MLSTVLINAIGLHRSAVAADEAMFDDACNLIHSEAEAEITLAAEIEAFRPVVQCKCQSGEDVQYKIDYLLKGDVGERDRLIDRIAGGEEDGVDLTTLLRSFSLTAKEQRS